MSLLAVEEAYRRLVETATPLLRRERLPLPACLGRVLAEDLAALRTQPAFDASAMDGYGVRAADTEGHDVRLRLIGESAAGSAFAGRVEPGTAVRIFTGAPLPEGADAVLIQENAERTDDGLVRVLEPVNAGRHIRRAGVDFVAGDLLLRAGARLAPGPIALAASGNHPVLSVLAKPRVAILATGDELVLPGEPLGPSQIVASNTFGVAALVEAAGGEVLDLGIARDEKPDIETRLKAAVEAGADVLVTIGGASVGDRDLVGAVFLDCGVELDFWKVAMRPGKPLMAGRLAAMRVLGLPGNPASSMVTATLFLAPLVRRLAGLSDISLYHSGILASPMPANDGRADFIRSTLALREDGTVEVAPLGRQDSSLLSIYAQADALLLRPANAPSAGRGDPCRYVRLT